MSPLLVLQKEVRGQHPSEAALPPKISVVSANRGAASYSSSRFHEVALERKFPPLQPFLAAIAAPLCYPWVATPAHCAG